MWHYVFIVAAIYAGVDFVLAIALGRCVLPGLRCCTCKQLRTHAKR